jgi:hypothetical protein
MREQPSGGRHTPANLYALIAFGAAFGLVEAAVVVYLRKLMGFNVDYLIANYRVLANLGAIAFISPQQPLLVDRSITSVEIAREAATIIMLAAVAFIAGHRSRQRIGAFLISFAAWDLFYYVFLKLLTGWPRGWFTKDIFFLIPVPWIGPVVTPVVASLTIAMVGVRWFSAVPATSQPGPGSGRKRSGSTPPPARPAGASDASGTRAQRRPRASAGPGENPAARRPRVR